MIIYKVSHLLCSNKYGKNYQKDFFLDVEA